MRAGVGPEPPPCLADASSREPGTWHRLGRSAAGPVPGLNCSCKSFGAASVEDESRRKALYKSLPAVTIACVAPDSEGCDSQCGGVLHIEAVVVSFIGWLM